MVTTVLVRGVKLHDWPKLCEMDGVRCFGQLLKAKNIILNLLETDCSVFYISTNWDMYYF